MKIFTIASGSTGNCTLVSDKNTCVLIDAGISMKRINAALDELGFCISDLSGILVTHEHSDHISGLTTLIKHYDIPIFAPRTVANHLRWSIAGVDDFIRELSVSNENSVGELTVIPFHTPHDTDESVGYRIAGSEVFGFCTDCGHVTGEVLEGLRGASAAVIEANHDLKMLQYGPYPAVLKRRILSDRGHLSNDCSGELAAELLKHGARSVVLGHLSKENNLPALAVGTVSAALEREGALPGRDIELDFAREKDILLVDMEGSSCLTYHSSARAGSESPTI